MKTTNIKDKKINEDSKALVKNVTPLLSFCTSHKHKMLHAFASSFLCLVTP